MRHLRLFLGFISFYLTTRTWRALHSPFLFPFFRFVFDRDLYFSAFDRLEAIRHGLLEDSTVLQFRDEGASPGEEGTLMVRDIAHRSLSSFGQCTVRFRTALYMKSRSILELGTSLGISAAYLAATSRESKVVTIDASEIHLGYAKAIAKRMELDNIKFLHGPFVEVLPDILKDNSTFDLVIMDGHHAKLPTLEYFDLLLPHLSGEAVVILDDIRWSPEMLEAWTALSVHPAVSASVDLYSYGMLFFRKDFRTRQQFRVLSSRLKPWEFF